MGPIMPTGLGTMGCKYRAGSILQLEARPAPTAVHSAQAGEWDGPGAVRREPSCTWSLACGALLTVPRALTPAEGQSPRQGTCRKLPSAEPWLCTGINFTNALSPLQPCKFHCNYPRRLQTLERPAQGEGTEIQDLNPSLLTLDLWTRCPVPVLPLGPQPRPGHGWGSCAQGFGPPHPMCTQQLGEAGVSKALRS